MKKLRKLLIIGDYFQLFNYPTRKQIIYLYKAAKFEVLEQMLTTSINFEYSEKEIVLQNVKIVSIFDDTYPELLRESYDPPLILYCKGNLNLLKNQKKIALVGSRRPQRYSMEATEKIFKDLINNNNEEFVIVSGLAAGIAGLSHKLAITYELPTIAVLGFGFNYMYPTENKALYEEICKYGLVVSEYPPHTSINKWQFVARNRIISGLCKVVVVIEAKKKSGSLITAELALSENREVFIVGGQSFDNAYYGSNQLIQEGAKLLLHVEEMLEEYKI